MDSESKESETGDMNSVSEGLGSLLLESLVDETMEDLSLIEERRGERVSCGEI